MLLYLFRQNIFNFVSKNLAKISISHTLNGTCHDAIRPRAVKSGWKPGTLFDSDSRRASITLFVKTEVVTIPTR